MRTSDDELEIMEVEEEGSGKKKRALTMVLTIA